MSQNGVDALTHISLETHPDLVSDLIGEYSVRAVPTFIVSNNNGEQRDLAGWSESRIRDDLDWLVAD